MINYNFIVVNNIACDPRVFAFLLKETRLNSNIKNKLIGMFKYVKISIYFTSSVLCFSL